MTQIIEVIYKLMPVELKTTKFYCLSFLHWLERQNVRERKRIENEDMLVLWIKAHHCKKFGCIFLLSSSVNKTKNEGIFFTIGIVLLQLLDLA